MSQGGHCAVDGVRAAAECNYILYPFLDYVLQSPVQSFRGFFGINPAGLGISLRPRDKSRFMPLCCSYSRSLHRSY